MTASANRRRLTFIRADEGDPQIKLAKPKGRLRWLGTTPALEAFEAHQPKESTTA